ncbi:MAG: hypothetical protein GC189_09730 [Alphaproteobacteria bacterium]|nr:hypothetical protein [Alphaproteobacteria bacterium]
MSDPALSPLKVRRSIWIAAEPQAVWAAFATLEAMRRWWGRVDGSPEAGTAQGQWLDVYEPRLGGRVEMAVMMDGTRVRYGGAIVTFTQAQELTFENDWIPNQAWAQPTFITLRLSPILGGALVELFHHGFERTGGDVAGTHAGFEQGWGMTQLRALKALIEA